MIGAQARHLGDLRWFDLSRCDLLLPWPQEFEGGGDRQRRRIHDAVGPERGNYVKFARTYSNAAWVKSSNGTGSAPVIVSETVANPDGALEATRFAFALNGGTTLADQSVLTQYEGSGLVAGATYSQGLWAKVPVGHSIVVRNVGASGYLELVGTGQWKRYKRSEVSGTGILLLEIGLRGGLGFGSDSVTVDLWWSTLEDGPDLTPVVPNDGGTVATTTDWPRTNKASVSEGTTANLDAALYVTDADRSIEGFDNAIAIPPASDLPGTGYAYKACPFPDGTLVTVSLFVEMDDGGVPVVSNSGGTGFDFMLVADGFGALGADCTVEHIKGRLYRATTHRVASIASGGNAFYGLVKYAAQSNRPFRVTGWHVRDSQGRIDAYIKSGSGGTSVVTPPFGELVTVASDQPRIEYGPDGIGRGACVERASANLLTWSQPKAGNTTVNGWNSNGGSGGDWIDNAAYVPGGGLTATYIPAASGQTKYAVTPELVAGSPYTYTWRVRSAGSTYYFLYSDGGGVSPAASVTFVFASKTFALPTPTVTGTAYKELEDGWWELSMSIVATANATVTVHAYSSADGGLYLGDVQFEPGATGTSVMPATGSGAAADAESISTSDLTALGLAGDEWTVIVEAQEPPATAVAYPMVLFMPAAAGASANINKQPGGTVAFEFYDGAVQRAIQIAGGAAGTRRRFALGFSRTTGVIRAGATGEAVQSATHANLAAFPAFTGARLGSDGINPARIDGLIAKFAIAPRLMTEGEILEVLNA